MVRKKLHHGEQMVRVAGKGLSAMEHLLDRVSKGSKISDEESMAAKIGVQAVSILWRAEAAVNNAELLELMRERVRLQQSQQAPALAAVSGGSK